VRVPADGPQSSFHRPGRQSGSNALADLPRHLDVNRVDNFERFDRRVEPLVPGRVTGGNDVRSPPPQKLFSRHDSIVARESTPQVPFIRPLEYVEAGELALEGPPRAVAVADPSGKQQYDQDDKQHGQHL
jgi:hypothetical protein